MSNVVAFKPRPKPQPMVEIPTNQAPLAVLEMMGTIAQWAADMGVDTDTLDFKFEGATIMTVLQGMLHKVKND